MSQQYVPPTKDIINTLYHSAIITGLAVAYSVIGKKLIKLENTLRHLMGEDLITHLGLDYYEDLVEDVIS